MKKALVLSYPFSIILHYLCSKSWLKNRHIINPSVTCNSGPVDNWCCINPRDTTVGTKPISSVGMTLVVHFIIIIGFGGWYGQIYQTLMEIILYRVSVINQARYCTSEIRHIYFCKRNWNNTVRLVPDYQYLWWGSVWSCLGISCVLASDRHWALCFVSLQRFDYVFHCDVSQMR